MLALSKTSDFAIERTDGLLSGLVLQISRCLKCPTPEVIHDLRVAIRRFGQSLAVFEPCFPPKYARKTRRRLRKMMSLAGEVRNADVAAGLVSRFSSNGGGAFLDRLKADRKLAERALTDLLKCRMDSKWRSKLLAGSQDVNSIECCRRIEDTARRVLRQSVRDFFKMGQRAAKTGARLEEIHSFRLTVKRFRYSLELFAPLYGSGVNQSLDQLKRIQTVLGAVND